MKFIKLTSRSGREIFVAVDNITVIDGSRRDYTSVYSGYNPNECTENVGDILKALNTEIISVPADAS